ncbi:Methyltransferase type 11, partial [mine drainage metagenome]
MLSETFSKAASIYDKKIRQNFINLYIRDREVSTLLKYYTKGKKVLEIGCGTGEECRRFIQATGASVVGLDISQGMIDFA